MIDEAVAFYGGIDITGDRWDTSEHRDDDPHRHPFTQLAYGPKPDATTAVSGAAAKALGDHARTLEVRIGRGVAPPPAGLDL